MDVGELAEGFLRRVVESDGMELLHVEYQFKGNASILRVYIDKPGGVNLEDCEKVSKHASVVLDVEKLIPHHYTLEVSSPGLERPLFKPSDYERFRGKEIRLVTVEKLDDRRRFRGFIREFSQGILKLQCEERVHDIPFNKIRGANLIHRFD